MDQRPGWRDRLTRIADGFENLILVILHIGLAILVGVGVVRLFLLSYQNFSHAWGEVTDAATFQDVFQRALGGFLVILLGLELLETVRVYNREHHVKLEVVLVVAMIAVSRHIIQLDYHEASAPALLGAAAILLALVTGYFLVKRIDVGPGRSGEK
jgi:uncharacterized membrane protein (DUF373 family)